MLKQIIKDLSLWLYELSAVMFNYDESENWWSDEEWDEWRSDNNDSFYLSEIISREIMMLAN